MHIGCASHPSAPVGGRLASNWLLSAILLLIVMQLIGRRTITEDRMLRNELAGYADYATKVRYRLIPGVL